MFNIRLNLKELNVKNEHFTFSFGTLLIVFSGLRTRNTLMDLIVLRFLVALLL